MIGFSKLSWTLPYILSWFEYIQVRWQECNCPTPMYTLMKYIHRYGLIILYSEVGMILWWVYTVLLIHTWRRNVGYIVKYTCPSLSPWLSTSSIIPCSHRPVYLNQLGTGKSQWGLYGDHLWQVCHTQTLSPNKYLCFPKKDLVLVLSESFTGTPYIVENLYQWRAIRWGPVQTARWRRAI